MALVDFPDDVGITLTIFFNAGFIKRKPSPVSFFCQRYSVGAV
ncbi:hypothetical protein [Pectobacterium brasiliense]|nr:hypothetical protein [Pectobacterium brasiliense]